MRARWLVGLLIGLAGVGCRQDAPAPPRTPVSPAPHVAAPPAPPASPTREQDALWALAPEGTTLGIVASPRGVALVERGMLAIQEVVASSPDLAWLHSQVMQALLRRVGTVTPTLAGFGLTHDKSFALFVTDTGQLVLVVPIRDRDKFLALAHGTKGADGDQLDGGVCKTIDGRYVCVQRPELLARLGGGGLDAIRNTAGARGDVEIAACDRGPRGPSIAVAAALDRGTFVLRGTVGRAPHEIVDKLGAPSRPRAGSATAGGFGVLDVALVLRQLPAVRLAPGVTLADLARSVSGPLTYVIGSGTTDPGVRIPLRDPAAARAMVEHCAELPALAGATVHDGTCHVPIPGSAIAFDGWVEGDELRIGDRASGPATPVAASPLAGEIAQGEWSAAFFGRGSYLAFKQARTQLPGAPPEADFIALTLPLFSELGIAIRKDGDALHFVLGARTVWTNPDDIVKKLLAISSADIQSGKAAQIAASIARAAPNSPFAQDVKAGWSGFVGVAAPIGVIAGVAIPALADGIKRARRPEAEVHLDLIGKVARRIYLGTGAFPRGEVALTPAASCCHGREIHCVSSPADWEQPVWKALEFKIDQPSLFRYSYKSDGKTMTATAVGDLDCDGVEITYELRGVIESIMPKFTLIPPPPNSD